MTKFFSFSLYRSNSKASYLPRQQREKLLDPDHGSYKLTLHELNENIKENLQDEISKCNLPDVLPVNVKYHNSYRHTHHLHRQPPPPAHHLSQHFIPQSQQHFHANNDSPPVPHTAPVHNGNHLKSIFQFAMGHSGSSTPTTTSSSASSSPLIPTSPFNGSTKSLNTPSPKYMSQSSIDLKMTQVIDPKLYTNDELIKTYHQQKEACRELNKTILNNSLQVVTQVNECDNKIAVVRKLNMVDTSPDSSITSIECKLIEQQKTTSTESLKSVEEKAMSEQSEKELMTTRKDAEAELTDETETESSDVPESMSTSPATVEKAEIVLCVHPFTQEMAVQTDETSDEHDSSSKNSSLDLSSFDDDNNNFCDDLSDTTTASDAKVNLWSSSLRRKKHPEEDYFDRLSHDLASQLSPSDKLHSILGEC